MDILKQQAKQSWSSDNIVLVVGSSIVANFGYDKGNGLDYSQAISVAKQFADSWNDKIDNIKD